MSTETVTYLLRLRDKFSGGMGAANRQISALNTNSNAASISIGRVGTALGALGILAVGKAILTAGMNMEQTRVAFATFLGSAEKGNKTIAQLNEFSNITPFNNDEVIKSGRVLLAAQTPAEKLQGTLKNIGDVAAGSQVPLTELSSIYGKIMNKGKAQAEELNQLSERGIPILQVLAKQYGITAEEVLQMGSDGKLTSDVIATAFSSMASEGGMFFNMMEKQSQTAGGKLSTLQGSLGLLASELGERANPAIGELLDKAINLTNYLKENKDTVILVAKSVALMTTAFVAYKVTVIGVQKATLLFNAVQKAAVITNIFFTKGLKKAQVAMRLFNVTARANPIGLVVSGLVLLLPLVYKLISGTDKISEKQKLLNDINSKASSIYAESAGRLNILKSRLEAGNITQKQRGEIIKEINKNYGSYLDKLLTEKSTDLDIAKALEQVNAQLLKKARLQAIEEKITETSKKQLDLEMLRSDAERVRQAATEGFWAKAQSFSAKLGTFGISDLGTEAALTKEKQSELNDEYKQTQDELNTLLELQREASKDIKIDSKDVDQAAKGVGLSKSAKETIETGIKAGAAKMITINIGNLVENFEIKTEQFKQAPIRVKEEMTKVLLDAINDASLLQR